MIKRLLGMFGVFLMCLSLVSADLIVPGQVWNPQPEYGLIFGVGIVVIIIAVIAFLVMRKIKK